MGERQGFLFGGCLSCTRLSLVCLVAYEIAKACTNACSGEGCIPAACLTEQGAHA